MKTQQNPLQLHLCVLFVRLSIFTTLFYLQVVPDAHKLTCQYKRHHPIYFYGPLKEETMFHEPWIVQYHDLMTDSEVAKIKELAKPKVSIYLNILDFLV